MSEAAGFLGSFEAVVRQTTLSLATGVEAICAVIVGYAVLETLWKLAAQHRRGAERSGAGSMETLRLRLGHWLALVLELLLAADILKTAVAPTWDDIGKLAAIAGIRTALNYFLDREVREEQRLQAAPPALPPHPLPHNHP
ncbi:hypothetical protein RDMS_02085 [Deinococcus sp. RL]|uniref:DUF1622 domain-containing protein n=1 Tax=Deinococcus sp. RL TaxID=1489678 RepID=UPI0004D6800D|nr:DUF1622 domain-containing protein [Deinococcus sp. RL]KEF35293.1 hypothetical protein RDMS_02085 [Deinococcus sp. RL]